MSRTYHHRWQRRRQRPEWWERRHIVDRERIAQRDEREQVADPSAFETRAIRREIDLDVYLRTFF